MNLAHVHLFLNHVPVLGTLFGCLLLLAAMVMKNAVLQKTGLVVLMLAALSGLPVYFTGEPAEEVVEHLAGVSRPLIEEHQDAAKIAIVALGILGIVALASVIVTRRRPDILPKAATVTLVLSVVVSILMFRTAGLGGQIRHTEIRGDTLLLAPSEQPEPTGAEQPRHDDDD